MPQQPRRLALDPATRDDEIGRWLAAAADARSRTLDVLGGLDREALDWPDDEFGSIATQLYHIAITEAQWLFLNLLQVAMPGRVARILPFDPRDATGRLTRVGGESVDRVVGRLQAVREQTVSAFGSMSLDEFRRARRLPSHDGTDVDATPEWVLHHLMQYEAEHRARIAATRERYRRAVTPGNST